MKMQLTSYIYIRLDIARISMVISLMLVNLVSIGSLILLSCHYIRGIGWTLNPIIYLLWVGEIWIIVLE